MAARAHAKEDRDRMPNRQELAFALEGLPSPAHVTIDLARAARQALAMPRAASLLQIAVGVGSGAATVTALHVQPQRIRLEIEGAPAVLNLTLQVACDGPFLFGWLHVPDEARSVISTSVERLRIWGPGYWAVPVWEPVGGNDGAAFARAEEIQSITHQRPAAPLGGRDRAIDPETVRSRDKPSS